MILLRRPWLVLVIACLIFVAVFWRSRPDFVASDPLWYANVAHDLATNPSQVFAHPDFHPFVMRLGLTTPVALLYRVFGVSDITTNLPVLIAALIILVVLYTSAATPRGKLVALAVGVLSTTLLQNALILNVDLPCGALMAVSIACLVRRDGAHGRWWLVGAVVAGFLAFLVKEVAVWCLPVWIYAAVIDARAAGWRPWFARYASALVVGAVLGVAYLGLCQVLWGDPLARFHGIDDLTYEHTWALPGQGVHAWVARLVWQAPILFAKLVGVTIIPALVAPWLVQGRDRIWWVAAATFVLLYWLGSSSLSAYAPLPISARMALPALAPLLVCSALALDRLIDLVRDARWQQLALAAFALVAVGISVRAGISTIRRAHPERAAFEAFRREAAAAPTQAFTLVCAEPRCMAIAPFYFGYDVPANVHIAFATDFAKDPPPAATRVRALVNKLRAVGAGKSDPQQDRTRPILALELPRLAGNQNVQLLDAGDGASLRTALN